MLFRSIRAFSIACTMLVGSAFAQENNSCAYESCNRVEDIYEYSNCNGCGDKHSFNYLKMGAGYVNNCSTGFGPLLGIGRRYERGNSAIDVSINFAGNNKNIYYSIPKIMHLRYITPSESSSLYFGGGLSLGGVAGKSRGFVGLMGEIALGYEMNRDQAIRTFVEFDFSQGMLPFHYKHKLAYNPVLSLAFGVGF